MSTVGAVVDRLYREYLTLADDQPTRAQLDTTVNTSVTTWVVDASVLDADEADMFTAGILAECGQELVLVTAVDDTLFPDTVSLTVVRGAAGTTAAAHTAGDLVYPAPSFPRRVVFDAVCDSVERLYPSLYRIASTAVTTGAYAEVPATVVDPIHFTYTSGGQIVRASAELYTDLAVTVSSTGSAVTVDAPRATTGTLVYRGKFARPTLEADDLSTLGVEAGWEQIVIVGAAATLLAGRELEQTTQELVVEQLRAQGYPVLSASRQRNELLRLYQLLLDQARGRQAAQHDELVTLSMPRFGTLG